MEFRQRDTEPSIEKSTTVNYGGMINDVSAGDTLVVDNGTMLMTIDEKQEDRIICTVNTAGKLGNRRHINLPGVRLNLPALTEKDHADLAVAVECESDYIAGSFGAMPLTSTNSAAKWRSSGVQPTSFPK